MLGCDIDPKLCLCTRLLGRAQFKPCGVKKEKDRIILTAHNGVAMVVMDREDYDTKTQALLSHKSYYQGTQQIKSRPSSSLSLGEAKRTTT